MSHTIEEHAGYIADWSRVAAYRAALTKMVRPGDVVVDLGCGTGVLGLLACQAGASRVYCIDKSRMLEAAREICGQSEFGERFSFVAGNSTEVEIPERADVVVADQMAPFGVGAGLLSSFADARRRFLKPSGYLLPHQLRLFVACTELPEFREQLARQHVDGIDLSYMRRVLTHDPRWVRLHPDALLGDPQAFATIQLGEPPPERMRAEMRFQFATEGLVDGVAGWFSVTLADGIEMTNSPLGQPCIDRDCIFLPFERPVRVDPGKELRIAVTVQPRGILFAWSAELVDASGKALELFRQTSFSSLLLGKKALASKLPSFVPELNERGRALLTALRSCDERQNLSEIIARIAEQHPDRLPSQGSASEFVHELLAGLVR